MKKVKIVAGLLMLSALAVGCGSNSNNTTQKAPQPVKINGGIELSGAAQYEGKTNLSKYEKAAAQSPTSANAQIQAAKAAWSNGNFPVAIAYYKKAITLDPTNVVPYNNLGNTYLRGLKQPQNALPYYQQAIKVNPSYGFAWLNLADCQVKLGQAAAAKATLQEALKKVAKTDPAYSGIQTQLTGK